MSQTPSSPLLMYGVAQRAPPCQRGVDSDTVLTQAVLQQLSQSEYTFCARYLSRTSPQRAGDLSREEAALILGHGFALIPVQHVHEPDWSPTRELGSQYGQAASQNARGLGVPPGVNIWCDLEGVLRGTPPEAVLEYCHAWYAEVLQGGYLPGLYVGYDEVLSSARLHGALPFEHYWSAHGSTTVAVRGAQLLQQGLTIQILNIQFDVDVTQRDHLKDSLVWWAPGPRPSQENDAAEK